MTYRQTTHPPIPAATTMLASPAVFRAGETFAFASTTEADCVAAPALWSFANAVWLFATEFSVGVVLGVLLGEEVAAAFLVVV